MSLWEDQGFIHCECHANHEAYPFRWWLIIPTIDIESIFNKLNGYHPFRWGPFRSWTPGDTKQDANKHLDTVSQNPVIDTMDNLLLLTQ